MKDKVSCDLSPFSFTFHSDPQETDVFYVNIACMQNWLLGSRMHALKLFDVVCPVQIGGQYRW